jgi:hypothetical protein
MRERETVSLEDRSRRCVEGGIDQIFWACHFMNRRHQVCNGLIPSCEAPEASVKNKPMLPANWSAWSCCPKLRTNQHHAKPFTQQAERFYSQAIQRTWEASRLVIVCCSAKLPSGGIMMSKALSVSLSRLPRSLHISICQSMCLAYRSRRVH